MTDVEKISYLEKTADYMDELRETPDLDQFFLELTLECNEFCFHCGSGCGKNLPTGMEPDVYKDVLNQVLENFGNTVFIVLTGGEPLLYRGFFEIIDYIKELGFDFGITTNATLITSDIARKLKNSGLYSVSISIDGTRDSHDRYRHLQGSYDRSMIGIQNLIDSKIPNIMVTTVANHDNIHELDDIFQVIDGMDVNSWRITGIEPIGRALEHTDMLLTPDDQKYLLSYIREKRQQGYSVEYGCTHYLGLEYEGELRNWMFMCQAGKRMASVTANGKYATCLNIPRNKYTIQGDVIQDRFIDVWENRYEFFRTPLADGCDKCRGCYSKRWCQGDSYHSWDYDNNQPLICMKEILRDKDAPVIEFTTFGEEDYEIDVEVAESYIKYKERMKR